MKVHLWEEELAQELLAHEDHAGHPEEQYVVTCFQKLVWVEDLQISGLRHGVYVRVSVCVCMCVFVHDDTMYTTLPGGVAYLVRPSEY